ncbi:SDR family NAD(P)-dependent oxidoreductase [Mycolicibacterium sp. J2]|uniref:SDR family NAD(P)-dependent oxidoreductase n=1 Tax=Mycolicibacterium sp. J2 TaxID=2993511 RepID=UPI00224B9BBA|nr:SDR family NAD(P)-dependent oxidoreductase [Mycolicibacterium sp. J2]MCX2715356.1 SDR family NAD(P)-dependent oxidoreductase [Mycolicibacterium sp. J2]
MSGFGPTTHTLVTGGSSGLGLEIARQIVTRGGVVTLLARDQSRLDDAAGVLRRETPDARVGTLSVDIRDADAVERAITDLGRTYSHLDTVINSAGILIEGRFERIRPEDFRTVMDINLHGTVNVCRAAVPLLHTSGGTVVNVASVAGLTGVFGYTAYCSSKHALVGFTRALSFELEPQHIRTVLVCPGEFDSPMVDALDATRTPENRAHTLTIPKLSVHQIAAETLAGVQAGRRTIVPGRRTRAIVLANRYAPRIADAVARRRIAGARGT